MIDDVSEGVRVIEGVIEDVWVGDDVSEEVGVIDGVWDGDSVGVWVIDGV